MAGTSRLPRLILLVTGVLLALVLAAWAAVTSFLPPARVRTLVQQQLAAVLARDVRFEGAGVTIIPPVRLNVTGLSLAEPGGFAKGAAFQARTLGLDLDVLALLRGRIVVRRMVLDRPALHLLTRADGSTNFDGLMKPEPRGARARKPMDLDIRELQVTGGKALLDDLKSARRTALDLDAKVTFRSESGGKRVSTSGETKVSALAFGPLTATRLSDLDSSLGKLEWRIAHAGKFDRARDRLALTRLELGFGGTRVALSGVVDHPGPKALVAMKATGSNVDLGEILGFLAAADARALQDIGGEGQLDFNLDVRGSLAPGAVPAVTGTLGLKKGRVRYASAPAAIEAISFNARFGGRTLDIADFSGRVANQPVWAQLHLEDFADPRVNLAVQGNFDLAAVSPLVAPRDTRLAGRANVNVRARGRAKDPHTMSLDGAVKLSGASVESPTLAKKLEAMSGDLEFSQTRARMTNFNGKAGKSSFAFDGTVERPLALLSARRPDGSFKAPPAGVNFNFRSPYLDLADVLPTAGSGPVLPNARGNGSVSIGRLKNGTLDVNNVVAAVSLEPAVLTSPRFSLDGYGGKVGGSARFDLTRADQPAFAVKAKIDTVSADALLSAWTPAKGVLEGVLSTDIDLSGAGSTPEQLKRTITAIGLAVIANGQLGPGPVFDAIGGVTKIPALKQMKFRDGRVPFRIERGRLVTDPVRLAGPYGDWLMAGAVGFDGALDYAVSITMPPEVVAALNARSALAAGALSDDQGRLLLDLRVTGTARAPRVAWDARAMQARLLGKASEAIADQRAKLEAEARAAIEARRQAAADSARAALERARARVADSLRARARDVLRGFFGTPKPAAPQPTPPPAPQPTPQDTAAVLTP
ncbi:MAG: AsmA family protein [Candidatus Eisenbacteria bacterium]